MNDNDLFDFDLHKDGELTPEGKAFLLTVFVSLAQHIAHILFNYKKDGDHND